MGIMDAPMNNKLVGFTNFNDINKFVAQEPWQPITTVNLPYSILSYPAGYISTVGSGCASMATVSPYDITYIFGAHVFRRALEVGNGVDVDWYCMGVPTQHGCPVYKSTPNEHHLKLDASLLNNVDDSLRGTLEAILRS